jgi:hypothetical protein
MSEKMPPIGPGRRLLEFLGRHGGVALEALSQDCLAKYGN